MVRLRFRSPGTISNVWRLLCCSCGDTVTTAKLLRPLKSHTKEPKTQSRESAACAITHSRELCCPWTHRKMHHTRRLSKSSKIPPPLLTTTLGVLGHGFPFAEQWWHMRI